ncbi:MAG: (d)CMP kinase [Candidatus Hydrothermarchaeales archaeon]
MIITIGGPIGSGKTTVAKAVAERFGLRHISAGIIFREMAKERRLSLEEFSRVAEGDESFDKIVDEKQKELAKKGNAVVDGRLSGRFIEEADIKIWLTAPIELRAERVSKRENKTLKQATEELKKREKSEAARYKRLYGINLYDISGYDVVLNTTLWSAEGVIKIIETLIEVKL